MNRIKDWIKLYRDILDDPEWHELDGDSAKALVMLWLIASEDGGNLPDTRKIAFRLRTSEKQAKQLLSSLSHWLDSDDIAVISDGYQPDTPEREEETEREEEKKECPARGRTVYSPEFEEFWKSYPKTPNMSKSEAWKAWQRLSSEDQNLAAKAVPKFIAWLKAKPDHPVVHVCRFLSQRRFDGFNEPELPDNVVPIGFYAEFGSAELDAWEQHNRNTYGVGLPRDKRGGWLVSQRWPPGHEPAQAAG
jgi:hypothetical protein